MISYDIQFCTLKMTLVMHLVFQNILQFHHFISPPEITRNRMKLPTELKRLLILPKVEVFCNVNPIGPVICAEDSFPIKCPALGKLK